MSAYIVPEAHINVIVSYCASRVTGDGMWHKFRDGYNYMTPQNAAEVAEILNNQNVRSVNYRYNEQTGNEGYRFRYIEGVRDLYSVAEIAKALSGLEYQSCETNDYYETEAYQILHDMRKYLLDIVANEEDPDTWTIDEVKQKESVYL